MTKQVVDYEGSVCCPIINKDITVLLGRHTFGDGGTAGSFVKVLCPYYKVGFNDGHRCQKGGKCGIAEGANR